MTTHQPEDTATTQSWFRQFMSDYRGSLDFSSEDSLLQLNNSIEDEDPVLHEFRGATFLVDLTAEGASLQADEDDVQKVLDQLRDHYNITQTSLLTGTEDNSTVDTPQLPPDGFSAQCNSLEPLTHFLNIIIHAAEECLPPTRYLKYLQFEVYGAEMQEMFDMEYPLRPDILALLPSCTPHQRDTLTSWSDVAVIVGVNHRPLELIQTLSICASRYLTVDRRRSFCIAITFNYQTLKMHFLIFHRSGISFSPPLSLNHVDGFQSAIKHMVGILSIQDEAAFGLDMTRVGNVYNLNDHGYHIIHTHHSNNIVCGRATVMYSLQRTEVVFNSL